MEIKNIKTDKKTVQTREKIKIIFEVWYDTDYPFDFPHDFPVATKKK